MHLKIIIAKNVLLVFIGGYFEWQVLKNINIIFDGTNSCRVMAKNENQKIYIF